MCYIVHCKPCGEPCEYSIVLYKDLSETLKALIYVYTYHTLRQTDPPSSGGVLSLLEARSLVDKRQPVQILSLSRRCLKQQGFYEIITLRQFNLLTYYIHSSKMMAFKLLVIIATALAVSAKTPDAARRRIAATRALLISDSPTVSPAPSLPGPKKAGEVPELQSPADKKDKDPKDKKDGKDVKAKDPL